MFNVCTNTRELPLRNTGIDLDIPRAKSESRKGCFDYKGVEFWNQLPFHARVSVNLPHFEYTVKAIIESRREHN